jgi:maleylacetoacetate isomerase
MPQVTLHTYWRSSSSYRVRLALAHKRIAYTPVFVNLLAQEQLAADYRRKSPLGHVPLLTVDGQTMVESVAICELLEDLFPDPPLYPTPRDPWARARVRSLVETINAGTQPLQNTSVLGRVAEAGGDRKAWAAHWNARGLAAFEALLESYEKKGHGGPFASGASFGVADCFLLPQLYSARRFDVDMTNLPRALAAERAALAIAQLGPALPENQPDAKS